MGPVGTLTQSCQRVDAAGILRVMAARSIGTGTISFGMVSIPIRLYSAAEASAAISFNLLDGKTKTRLKQQYVNQAG